MRTLLIILSYAKANDMVARHWPYFLKAGCDIMGVGREDSDCRFPTERLVYTAKIGKDSYVDGANLPEMHVRALEVALSLDYNQDTEAPQPYDSFALTEPDAIFLKPLPLHRGGLMATYSGGNSPGFLGSFFCHGPWHFDRWTAKQAVNFGKRMIAKGLVERGFPDRFWGLWCDLYDTKFTSFPNSYSQNRLDRPEFIQQARDAIAKGAFYVHGIKTIGELQAVTV